MKLKKTILLHCHIFKNAGTTLFSTFQKQFRSDAITLESDESQFLSSDKIIESVVSHPRVKCISSHRLSVVVPDDFRFNFIPLILIRNPLERLASMYTFYKNQKKVISHECALAQSHTLRDFVEILIQADMDSSFKNLQCLFFVGDKPEISEEVWAIVEDRLNNLNCLGLVERYDESMVVWEDYFTRNSLMLDLSYTMQNVSSNQKKCQQELLDDIANNLGGNLLAEFCKRNKFDYRLYEKCKSIIEEKVKSIIGFDDRLKSFKERNERALAKKRPQSPPVKLENSETYKPKSDLINILLDDKRICLPKLENKFEKVRSNKLKILACQMVDSITLVPIHLVEQGQIVKVLLIVRAYENIKGPLVGFSVENVNREMLFGMNNYYAHVEADVPTTGTEKIYSFTFQIPPLNHGSYSISPAFAVGTQDEHMVLSLFRDTSVFYIAKITEPQLPGILYVKDYEFSNCLPLDV